jgi:Fic family protein
MLWPLWDSEDALHVAASNAIEGNSLTRAETAIVLNDGTTIGGKTIREHLEAVYGQRAYVLMLKLAKNKTIVTTEVIRDIHHAVVGNDVDFGGKWRKQAVYIRNSRHVPPNHLKIPYLMDEMIDAYLKSIATEHPIAVAAKLHLNFVGIHPFVDGNGRTARLLGNLELIRSGFAPILLDREDRREYFSILERCHTAGEPGKGDPKEFIAFIEKFEENALERYLRALDVSQGVPFEQTARQVGLAPRKNVGASPKPGDGYTY